MIARHLKCVVLVIASHTTAFDGFKRIWEQHWDQSAELLKGYMCMYLYNDPTLTDAEIRGNDFYFPNEETYPAPGLLLKTMNALQHLEDNGITFDFLLRTNLSSLFNWKAFDRFLSLQQPKSLVAGVPYNTKRMSGMCMILSADLVQQIKRGKSSLDYDLPDDEAINQLLHTMPNNNYTELKSVGIELIDGKIRPSLSEITDSDFIHFRFHSGWVEGNLNREKDHLAMDQVRIGLFSAIVEHFCTSIKNDPIQAGIASLLIIWSVMFVRKRGR
jgi:hypothetical protein